MQSICLTLGFQLLRILEDDALLGTIRQGGYQA